MAHKLLPVLPLRNAVAWSGLTVPFLVRRPGAVAALKQARAEGGLLLAVAQKNHLEHEPDESEMHRVGTLLKIEKVSGSDSRGYQVMVRGLARYRVDEFVRTGDHWNARAEAWAEVPGADQETIDVLFKSVKDLAHEILDLLPGNTKPIEQALDEVQDPELLASLCAFRLELPMEKQQQLIEAASLKDRILGLLEQMRERREAISLQNDIRNRMSEKIGKQQRESILREQLKAIHEELGDGSEEDGGGDLSKKIQGAAMPDDIRKIAEKELKRLETIGSSSPESNVIRTYLDWLITMPWDKESGAGVADLDLDAAQAVLDEDHYGLDKIKKRIIQNLAVMKLKKAGQGSILLFVGPPGVGKTSLGQSIAKALGRKFVRASLGGMRDDAEIRGHRRTYIGALPGRIIQGIKRAGEKDPVFMLDEIDKLSQSFYGDPAGALLEVLDPEQNKAFNDHYLDVPFDLSKVLFVATANTLDTIPAPLLDRMEVIHLSGYTTSEKLGIAKRYLVPKQRKENGLGEANVEIDDETLVQVITKYTRESGVRELQRRIGALFRAAAEKVIRKTSEGPVKIDTSWLEDAFGLERFTSEVTDKAIAQPGVVTGLAWTPQGGEILLIEAKSMPGKGGLMLTGQLGDVMKESAQIAMSIVRSQLAELAPTFEFDRKDIHIHVPSGAIPKDGPSAGITLMTSIASLLTGRAPSHELAMTGEITLRGAVMPVGGIKEKVIAAHRAGIKQVVMSRRNQRDLREVPEEVKSQMQFHFVENAAQVLEIALGIKPEPAALQSVPGLGGSQNPQPAQVTA